MPLTQLTQKLILKGAFNLQYEYYLVLDVYAGKIFKKKCVWVNLQFTSIINLLKIAQGENILVYRV